MGAVSSWGKSWGLSWAFSWGGTATSHGAGNEKKKKRKRLFREPDAVTTPPEEIEVPEFPAPTRKAATKESRPNAAAQSQAASLDQTKQSNFDEDDEDAIAALIA